ncbi:polysaccharide biosynthesis/export family protein [Ruegeria arenilitoris]|uniref:polysaccharide biosynthesis/export family protein n=1 Tax=Ruegeria arenilitoris TaxID=1173585 RepID=UPI00147BC265|nr:polysaccharide biosynthesis/export family protein [Ruegeria arenilitoris]
MRRRSEQASAYGWSVTTPYRPRSLPQSFYETASTGPAHSRLAALPDGPAVPDFTPEPLELRAPPRVKAPPYHLGPGDMVAIIRPARVAELAGAGAQRDTFTARDDGTISIPDAGRVQVPGRTISEAETTVSLEVVVYNSKHVAVGGLVATPVVVPLTVTPLTLGQAIAAAGGLTTRDRELGTIRIYRSGDLYKIPLRNYLARPDFRQLVLLNGDAVFADTSYDLDRLLRFIAIRSTSSA